MGRTAGTDFPAIDNENWLKSVKVTLQDGAWSTEVVDLDDSVIDKETLATMLPDFGIDMEVVH